MFFTLEDYRKIEEFLKKNSKKDSDFPSLNPEDPLNENDFIAIVHNEVNHKVNLLNFADFLDSLLTLYKYLTKIEELTEEERLAFAKVDRNLKDLLNQIDGILQHGVAVSNEFGNNPHISISQQKLTATINTLYNLLEEALGRVLRGFTWTVTPTYIYGEWPTSVHIEAQPSNLGDVFEHITLKVNNEIIDQVDEQVSTYSFDIPLQISANIHLDAQILGIPYYREQLVNHYDSFWLGAGTAYTDIMDEAHNINISQGSRLAKNITAADNDHIIIIIGETWVPSFIRADMNGAEIQFTELMVTIDGKNYKVLTSEDTYEAGTYNIDING